MPEKDAQLLTLFKKAQLSFSRMYTAILSNADVTLPQFAVLNLLSQCDSPIPMSKASQGLELSKPAITNLVDRLEEKNLLKRIPDPNDRRVHLLEIQPEGKRISDSIQEDALSVVWKSIENFSSEEKKVITHFYEEIVKNLVSKMESCCKMKDKQC